MFLVLSASRVVVVVVMRFCLVNKVRECEPEELEGRLEECNGDPEVHGACQLVFFCSSTFDDYFKSLSPLMHGKTLCVSCLPLGACACACAWGD